MRSADSYRGARRVKEREALKAAPEAVKVAKEHITWDNLTKALENALDTHRKSGTMVPLPLSKDFVEVARKLGWVEGVEFMVATPAIIKPDQVTM